MWSRILGPMAIESQWYEPVRAIARSDIPVDISTSPRVKGYICHLRRTSALEYYIFALVKDGQVIQSLRFVGKRLIYQCQGKQADLDLSDLPDNPTFTLAAQWGRRDIELRATWLPERGTESESHWLGRRIRRTK